jgi:long-chain acyl-CoA synthetase
MMTEKTSYTITAHFYKVAEKYPQNIIFNYFRDGWKSITYQSFRKKVTAAALSLIGEGLKRGDRVAIIAENRPEWCSVYLAILTAGGIAVPVDSQLGAAEIENLLYDSGTGIVFYSRATEAAVLSCAENLSKKETALTLINLDSPEFSSFSQTDQVDKPVFSETSPDGLASIIYTSGTTGRPKGVMLTHRNFCSDAGALISAGIVTHNDNVLAVLPLHHTYAFMCTFIVPVFVGGSVTYPESLKGPDLLSAIKEKKVTVLIGVPQLLGLLRNGILNKFRALNGPLSFVLLKLHSVSRFCRGKWDINIGRLIFSSVHRSFGRQFRFFGSGGAKLDPEIMKDLEGLGFTVMEGYGLTETSPVLTFNPFRERKPGSAGKPLPSVELRIAGPPETGEGEIEVRGPMVMQGYYNESANAEVFRDGWFRTGDIGRIDEDGYLFITGRTKEVIVLSSGKNIYPEDLEREYVKSPVFKEICIAGKKLGDSESLHAVVVPDFEHAKQTGITNIREEIKFELNRMSVGMPSFMRVTGFSISREPLPRTPLGKLRRFLIADMISSPPKGKRTEKDEGFPRDEISELIMKTLRQFTGKEDEISRDDNLDLDLGFDSLSRIELTASLEKTFSLKLPENFSAEVQTVRDLTEKIREQTANGFARESAGKAGWKAILDAEPPADISLGRSKAVIPVFLMHTFLKLLFRLFFRLKANGLHNLPAAGNFILTPNHTSYLDGFALLLSIPYSRFKDIYSLGLSKFFTGAVKSRFAKIANIIPIDSASYANTALQASAYVLKNGFSISVFPEGGRSFDGNLMEFKKGVGILAVETGVPVVPVYITGAMEALPRTAVLPKPAKITVTFGKPFSASELDLSKKPSDKDAYQFFADLLRQKVEELKK